MRCGFTKCTCTPGLRTSNIPKIKVRFKKLLDDLTLPCDLKKATFCLYRTCWVFKRATYSKSIFKQWSTEKTSEKTRLKPGTSDLTEQVESSQYSNPAIESKKRKTFRQEKRQLTPGNYGPKIRDHIGRWNEKWKIDRIIWCTGSFNKYNIQHNITLMYT